LTRSCAFELPAERLIDILKKSTAHPFIERTLAGLADVDEHANTAVRLAERQGLLQSFDPRVKLFGALLLILAAMSSRGLGVTLAIFVVALALARLSRIPLRLLATRVWLGVLFFTGCIALPAIFTTPGLSVWRLPLVGWPVTAQGLRSAAHLLLRAETSATWILLVVLSTSWTQVLKALRALRVPVTAVVILGMTHRYIFLLLQLAREQFEARRSRLVGVLSATQRRKVAASSAGVLLDKSVQLSGEAFSAMQARGFRGEIYTLDDFRMNPRDWCALIAFVVLATFAFLLGARP
jgi:cobalt/nickel transport system permease protein